MCIRKMVKEETKTFTGYIYKIKNLVNNKIYIGQTKRAVEYRFKQHLRGALKENSSSYNTRLSRAIRKYGNSNFIIESIDCINCLSRNILCKELDQLEKKYILKYNATNLSCGYNIQKGGHISSEEALQKQEKQKMCYEVIINNTVYKSANNIILYNDHAEIILCDSNNNEKERTFIDIEDVEKIISYRWGLLSPKRGSYAYCSTENIRLEKIITDCPNGFVIVHLNKNGLDNRKENLKIVSQTEKQQNSSLSSNNTSGYKGVWFCKDRNKWQAQITIGNKQKSLGRFDTFEEAVAAREAAEKVYYNKWN